jgi:hypothetical protein
VSDYPPWTIVITGPQGGMWGGDQWIAPHTEVVVIPSPSHYGPHPTGVRIHVEDLPYEALGRGARKHFPSPESWANGSRAQAGGWWVERGSVATAAPSMVFARFEIEEIT